MASVCVRTLIGRASSANAPGICGMCNFRPGATAAVAHSPGIGPRLPSDETGQQSNEWALCQREYLPSGGRYNQLTASPQPTPTRM